MSAKIKLTNWLTPIIILLTFFLVAITCIAGEQKESPKGFFDKEVYRQTIEGVNYPVFFDTTPPIGTIPPIDTIPTIGGPRHIPPPWKLIGKIALASLLISLLVFFLLEARAKSAKSKKKNTSNGITSRNWRNENIEEEKEENLETILKQVTEEGDFQMAVRTRFILLLKKLDEAGILKFRVNKSNRDYLRELETPNKFPFERIVSIYEHIWFGNMPVDAQQFAMIDSYFDRFTSTITNNEE